MKPSSLILFLLSALTAIFTAVALSGCASMPVAVSYTGQAAGHQFTVGYSGKGVGVVISQK